MWWESAAGVSDTIFADAFSYSSCELVLKSIHTGCNQKDTLPVPQDDDDDDDDDGGDDNDEHDND